MFIHKTNIFNDFPYTLFTITTSTTTKIIKYTDENKTGSIITCVCLQWKDCWSLQQWRHCNFVCSKYHSFSTMQNVVFSILLQLLLNLHPHKKFLVHVLLNHSQSLCFLHLIYINKARYKKRSVGCTPQKSLYFMNLHR